MLTGRINRKMLNKIMEIASELKTFFPIDPKRRIVLPPPIL
jgi:hypothetical protein